MGTTVKFTRTFADFPSIEWKYAIYWNGPQKFNQDGEPYPVPGSTGFLIEVPASVATKIQPGSAWCTPFIKLMFLERLVPGRRN